MIITSKVQTEWIALSETTSMHASTDLKTVGKITNSSKSYEISLKPDYQSEN